MRVILHITQNISYILHKVMIVADHKNILLDIVLVFFFFWMKGHCSGICQCTNWMTYGSSFLILSVFSIKVPWTWSSLTFNHHTRISRNQSLPMKRQRLLPGLGPFPPFEILSLLLNYKSWAILAEVYIILFKGTQRAPVHNSVLQRNMKRSYEIMASMEQTCKEYYIKKYIVIYLVKIH